MIIVTLVHFDSFDFGGLIDVVVGSNRRVLAESNYVHFQGEQSNFSHHFPKNVSRVVLLGVSGFYLLVHAS